ncbi:MAG: MarR family transcriptional regulator [Candidatus Omnitrophota bacterium]
MVKGVSTDFAKEMAKMLPTLMRAVTSKMEVLLTRENLAVSHIVVLDMLGEKGSCTMGELAQALNLSMGAVTGVVDKMIEMEIVERERSSEDRRVVKVGLVEKGKALVSDVNKMRIDATKELYSALTDEEREEYLRMIRKIYGNLR